MTDAVGPSRASSRTSKAPCSPPAWATAGSRARSNSSKLSPAPRTTRVSTATRRNGDEQEARLPPQPAESRQAPGKRHGRQCIERGEAGRRRDERRHESRRQAGGPFGQVVQRPQQARRAARHAEERRAPHTAQPQRPRRPHRRGQPGTAAQGHARPRRRQAGRRLGSYARKRLRVSASATQNATTAYAPSTSAWRSASSGQRSMNIGRTSSTALVSGNHSENARNGPGSCSRGKNTPDKNIIGVRNSVK